MATDNDSEGGMDEAFLFLRCVVCHSPMVASACHYQCGIHEYDWSIGERLWPSVEELNHPAIPAVVTRDLRDAKKCFDAGVYSATVVMCGKALEGVVREKCNEVNLSKGLAKLKENQVIDDRLFQWSELLRKERNLGAHSNETEITKENARDLYDFVLDLCEYIFILTDKFNAFIARQTNP